MFIPLATGIHGVALDVNLQQAAKQRSELSPRRGFASLGVNSAKVIEPRRGDTLTGNQPEPVY